MRRTWRFASIFIPYKDYISARKMLFQARISRWNFTPYTVILT